MESRNKPHGKSERYSRVSRAAIELLRTIEGCVESEVVRAKISQAISRITQDSYDAIYNGASYFQGVTNEARSAD